MMIRRQPCLMHSSRSSGKQHLLSSCTRGSNLLNGHKKRRRIVFGSGGAVAVVELSGVHLYQVHSWHS
jgi:hypothetical protein